MRRFSFNFTLKQAIMGKVRVTRQFNFEMAHALAHYDGPCRNLHGHSYRLFVTVAGEPLNEGKNPKNGMVIDFGDLKRLVKELIVDELDHAVMISNEVPVDQLKNTDMFNKLHVVGYQPTCENMVIDFAERIKSRLPHHIELISVRLHETATSYAEWFASDNP
jgi:6-pyruvoyltetrahydropterin/6-carboxytetrahydropterin synthase